jgi:hypothetical protein
MINIDDPRYVKRPTPEEVAKRLLPLGLRPEDIRVPPLLVQAGDHVNLASCGAGTSAYRRPLPKARDFDHLKEMIGVPNRVFQARQDERIFEVDEAEVVREGVHHFHRRHPSPSAAYKMAANLVYRYADPELLQRSPYRELTQLLLAVTEDLSAVVGGDLVVDNDTTVYLGDDPVVSFDRIIIHGTGRIVVGPQQKVIANVVQYLPAS